MSTITDLVALILDATRGDQVRDSIADALLLCYQDGRAGAVDLQARGLANRAMNQNEQQEAEIAVLQAIVEELQGGGSGGGGSSGSTTTEVPTVIFDCGYEDFSRIDYGNVMRKSITFNKTFTEAPTIITGVVFRENANPKYEGIVTAPIRSTITTTGFDLTASNRVGTGETVSPTVVWVALQPTVVEVNTEIIVPATDDLTEEQIQSLIGLLE